jgi:hypothetical protein
MRYLLLIFLLINTALHAQQTYTEIPLPAAVAHRNNEYSSLALWKSRIILTPQYPARYIYSLDTSYIDAVINGTKPIDTLYTFEFINLYPLIARVQYYQGFEAAVVVGNRIFYTIETGLANPHDFLVRGTLTDKKIVMDTGYIVRLPKLAKDHGQPLDEAGHESITYLPQQNKLLVLFEFNNFPGRSKGWLIDTSFTKPDEIAVQPIDFRITDIHEKNGKMYAINYGYTGEFEEYEPTEKIKKGDGRYANWKIDCITRVIELELKDNEIRIKPKPVFTFDCENWEGILQYRKGVLMITDQHPRTKFVYLPF